MNDVLAVILNKKLEKLDSNKTVLPEKNIDEIINDVLRKYSFVNDERCEEIQKDTELIQEIRQYIEERFYTEVNNTILKIKNPWNREKWIEKWNGEFTIFKAFKLNLLTSLDNLSLETIDYIEKDIDEILNQIPNPCQYDYFSVSGLVFGLVQMGKTTNMCGLICKALDIGYSIIILFTGTTKDLRNQGQKRFERDCYGKDTLNNNRIGIGKYLLDIGFNLITKQDEVDIENRYIDGDLGYGFDKYVKYEENNRYVFICKRNTSIIRRIIKWVEKQEFYDKKNKKVINIPLLLIQDECDQAALNTRPEDEIPASTNKELRKLYDKFNKKVCIGYTATPFGNIFINPNPKNSDKYGEDFFPKDFIYLLKPPKNYLGPYEYFGVKPYPFIKEIDEKKELKSNTSNTILESSLEKAIINYFINGGIIALRDSSKEHHTMLINIDTYTEPQEQVYERVMKYVEKLRNDILSGNIEYLKPICKNILDDIKKKTKIIEKKDIEEKKLKNKYNISFTFQEIFDSTLNYIISKAENGDYIVNVEQVNYKNTYNLDYADNEQGLNVIVIGGLKLSRGLTLKGLSVAYFRRTSPQADTQLQACRWFGYPKEYYRDLIRVYTTSEIHEFLKLSTEINMELEKLIIRMSAEKETPENFGLYIKKVGKIKPTSSNKMRSARKLNTNDLCVIKNDLRGQEYDVNTFYCSNYINKNNKESLDKYIKKLGKYEKEDGAFVWRNSNPIYLLDFLKNIKVHEKARIIDLDKVCQYIKSSNINDELNGMDVVLINITKGTTETYDVGNIRGVKTARRTGVMNEKADYFIVNEGRALTVRHLKYGLSEKEVFEAENRSGNSFKEGSSPSSSIVSSIRAERKAGVIIFYLLSVNHLNLKCDSIRKYTKEKIQYPPVAFHISLPGQREDGEEIIANKVYMENILDALREEQYGNNYRLLSGN